jgi:hypothetical protein
MHNKPSSMLGAVRQLIRGSIAVRAALPCVLLACACGANSAPLIARVDDQNAAVGLEVSVQVRATDPDGDSLGFSFEAPELPNLDRRKPPATFEKTADGIAVFRWIPQATDARPEPYDLFFTVDDGRTSSQALVRVYVREQGGTGAPVFVKPLGSGTTLMLDTTPCLELPVEVADTDSTMVAIGQEEPLIEGATLTPGGKFSATWKWCPTASQIQAQDRFYLRLSADDHENPKTIKLPPYLIVVVSSGKGTNCPGQGPVITHTPLAAQSTVQDLKVQLSVTDDVGLKATPLLYWAESDPGNPPDLSKMMPVATTRTSGDAKSGSYEGVIPNPVASSPSGTMKTVHYLVVARDNDDPTGGCNHSTYEPATATHSFVVTAGGAGGLGACEACTSDAQCGGANDNCITIGGALRCATACGANNVCPTGYTCTGAAVMSVDGKSARQCVPTGGACTVTQACTDDNLEENDSLTIANATAAALPGTSYPSLMICPLQGGGADEDYFGIPVSAEGDVTVSISSTATADLDLILTDKDGNYLEGSGSTGSNESATVCVPASIGKIIANVYPYGDVTGPVPYSLTVARAPKTCPCQPDVNEPDGTAATATVLNRPTTAYTASNLRVCAGDLDFYKVTLNAGDSLKVDLTFTQGNANQDLDIHIYKSDGTTDLTPCSQTQGGCMTTNGQGYQSDEHMLWAAPAAGTYYVVIRGFDNVDEAGYALSVKVQ